MPTVNSLIDRLWATPLGQQLVRDEAAEKQRDRQAQIEALAALERHELAEMPKLMKARDDAERKRTAALESVKRAQEEFNRAFVETQTLSARVGQQRQELMAAIEETAPPAIDALIGRLQSEAERLRHETPDQRYTGRIDPVTRVRLTESNIYKIRDRIRAIGPAIEQTRELKYQNIEPTQLEKQLQQIWDSLPSTALAASAT